MRRVLDYCLASLCALPASASYGIAAQQREPARRALLVGIEHYPPDVHWPILEGPAHDVAAMHDVLVTRFGFRSEDVEELHDEAATHAGIAAALERLAQRASTGDLILFYFAGHGSRLPDDDPDEGSDGWDPTLVPYDASAGPKRDNDIRDDEIGRWIARANLKTDQVVLVFDCGSSGPGVAVEGPERSRYLSPEARGVALTAARAGTVSLLAQKRSGWVPPRARCVALSACRSTESAFEVRVETTPSRSDSGPARSAVGLYRGLFSMSLIDELSAIDSDASWSDLSLRVSARVAAKTARQTPVIEGNLAGYGLFRNVAAARAPRFEADLAENGRLHVHGGILGGLAPGAVIAVCSPGATQDDADLRYGEAEIVDASAGGSTARWRRTPAPAVRPGACRAFLLESSETPALLPVSVEGETGAGAVLAQALEATHLLRRVDPADARYRIAASVDPQKPGWRVLDAGGRALSAVAEDSPIGIGRLVAALSTLGRAWRLEQLLASSPARDLRTGVGVKRIEKAWSVSAVNRSDVPIYANFVIVCPDGRIAVPCPPCPDDRTLPGAAATRCTLPEFEIPPELAGFYAGEPVRLYGVWTPRWHDLSALAQDGFSLGPDSSGADAWSLSELAEEMWVTDATEIALR